MKEEDGDMLFLMERHVASSFFRVGDMSDIWPSFDWADPLLLESALREEEKLVRDTARGFAQSRLMPLVRDMHRHENFDRGLLQEMGAVGILGRTCLLSTSCAAGE